ncbi:EAL domain-containing protein [Synechococcus sp. PCC 6312]|uniref:EAL domain-containing response regulator n=1 Tax=Synechococcus sp. (strain ATCC 27167 / PCC 6312) TaxID=195253 RepID=UPI00029ED98D|nr:EAL domain-containing protein [Synechococcus sp. PCC 6312]AFY61981.1 diguanylate cyclase (GGDEF) domain-containing protein [Synechococcus sp. PCC 6312]
MATILIVDDDPHNYDVIEMYLADQDHCLHYAADGQTALSGLERYNPDLILLDLMMPGLKGLEVCQRIKAASQWEGVPIIMVTALSSKQDLFRCLDAGADDFVTKPVNRMELRARVQSMLRIRQQYQDLASFNATLEATVQARTADLQQMINQDPLTQLPSRTALVRSIHNIQISNSAEFALIILDCDEFKLVNGSLGYLVGDQLLTAIATRLRQLLGPGDLLARMGEDEFCYLKLNVASLSQLKPFLAEIQHRFQAPFSLPNAEIFMTASLGITFSDRSTLGPEELLKNADIAMYQAKQKGRGSYQLYDHQMHLAIVHRLTLESDLQRALDRQEFIIYYQPIFSLKTQEISGFEALIRWQHPSRGTVSPGEFISCLETTGFIVPVGLLILRQACAQLQQWHRSGYPDLTMGINISIRQFACPTLLDDIDQIISETQVNPAYIKLEITETCIMENAETTIALTQQLRARQIQISIDDFGTGYSSLSYLHCLPVNTLKIDRCFVAGITPSTTNYQVVKTIMLLSQQLGLDVVAEGIETESEQAYLLALGCQFGQGYFFDRPLPAAMVAEKYLTGPPLTVP